MVTMPAPSYVDALADDFGRIQTSDFQETYEGTVTGHSAVLNAYIRPDSQQLTVEIPQSLEDDPGLRTKSMLIHRRPMEEPDGPTVKCGKTTGSTHVGTRITHRAGCSLLPLGARVRFVVTSTTGWTCQVTEIISLPDERGDSPPPNPGTAAGFTGTAAGHAGTAAGYGGGLFGSSTSSTCAAPSTSGAFSFTSSGAYSSGGGASTGRGSY